MNGSENRVHQTPREHEELPQAPQNNGRHCPGEHHEAKADGREPSFRLQESCCPESSDHADHHNDHDENKRIAKGEGEVGEASEGAARLGPHGIMVTP